MLQMTLNLTICPSQARKYMINLILDFLVCFIFGTFKCFRSSNKFYMLDNNNISKYKIQVFKRFIKGKMSPKSTYTYVKK